MSSSQTINILDRSIDLVERYAKCVLNESSNKNDKANLKELGNYILHFNNAKEITYERDDIFEEFNAMIDSSLEELDSSSILEEFGEKISSVEMSLENSKKCQKYKDFMKLISKDPSDEEIVEVSQSLSALDPISKRPIEDPVKNRKCGHVYDKNTILEFIDRHPKTKCPIPGCDNSDYIKKSNLIPDNSFKRILSGQSNENPNKKAKVYS